MEASEEETAGVADPGAATVDASRGPGERGRKAPHQIGRFSVLRLLGSGGMGSVFSAFDEKLDRKVALKLLHRMVDDVSHGRMLREAQAMAKVDHPNVVKVFEAGEHDGQLYLAMEFVDGQHLGQWRASEKPSWEAVLTAYRQAGRGLAAAHCAGLVHRDFKPHNVMIDAAIEGRAGRRVRVLDFGLAGKREDDDELRSLRGLQTSGALRTPLTETGAVMGTPAYMAPEQIDGRPATDKSDQFSFCVAMWEALYDERPFAGDSIPQLLTNVSEGVRRAPPDIAAVPSWIRIALERGLHSDPEARWPNMDALLAALSVGHRRRRRTWWLAGSVAAAALVGAWVVLPGSRACDEADEALAQVWSPQRRADVRERLAAVDADFAPATAERADAALQRYADSWVDARREACGAGAQVMLERARCLDDRLRAFAALVEVLESPDAQRLESAPRAAAELPQVSLCSNPDYVAAQVAPPADETTAAAVEDVRGGIAQAYALRQAGDYRGAATMAEAQVLEAQEIGYDPLLTEAHNELGWVLLEFADDRGAHENARAAYVRSSTAALSDRGANLRLLAAISKSRGELDDARAHAEKALFILEAELGAEDAEVADSRGLLASVLLQMGRIDEALLEEMQVLAIRQKIFGPNHPDVASSHNQVGNALIDAARYDEAEASYRRALAIWKAAFGPQHPDVAVALNNLGNARQENGAFEESLALHLEALAIYEASLGPHHPSAARCRGNAASALADLGRFDEALAQSRRALEDLEAKVGLRHPQVGYAVNRIGTILDSQGDPKAALEAFRRTSEIWTEVYGPEHPLVAVSVANAASILAELGDYDGALLEHRRALQIRERVLGREHADVANSLNLIGRVLSEQRRFAEALEHFRRSLEIVEATFGPDHPKVATAHNNIGTCLDDLGRRDEALAEHRLALAIRERALGSDHVDVAVSYNNIGSILQDRGDYEAAIEHYRKSLAMRIRQFGSEHPDVALAHNNIGVALFRSGDHNAAIPELRTALAIWKNAYGEAHPDVASTHYSIGRVLMDAQRDADALSEFRLCVQTLDSLPSPVLVDHVIAVAMVSVLAARTGHAAEARAALERVSSIAGDNPGDEVVRAISTATETMVRSSPERASARAAIERARPILQEHGEGGFARLADAWLAAD